MSWLNDIDWHRDFFQYFSWFVSSWLRVLNLQRSTWMTAVNFRRPWAWISQDLRGVSTNKHLSHRWQLMVFLNVSPESTISIVSWVFLHSIVWQGDKCDLLIRWLFNQLFDLRKKQELPKFWSFGWQHLPNPNLIITAILWCNSKIRLPELHEWATVIHLLVV